MKLLLHACCGPCSLEPVRKLQEAGHDLTIYYANSNIAPADEYERRREVLCSWADEQRLPVIEGSYEPAAWEAAVHDAVCSRNREERCRACYRLRFRQSAAYAASHGFEALGTTLSVSPYQYTDIIKEELEAAAKEAHLTPLFEDYRPFYDEATRRSKALGMYRQNWCGCRISAAEAAAEREERKAARAAARAAHAAEHAAERAEEQAAQMARKAQRAAYDKKQQRKREILKQIRLANKAQEQSEAEPTPRTHN
ncbi:epoxyqueuosine reductase QueH [Adlercreutzia agrestimuris]|uniref:epoxyqueuosine reductase QueH n=1 Tax=Adlercreutzia agrestimuris TaxID=2941324 RepID=UPI00203C30D1|nr:epoxyqueuosine reductase QueH [Adlercreutzia agrestimuris]